MEASLSEYRCRLVKVSQEKYVQNNPSLSAIQPFFFCQVPQVF
jgi:hypothetical protein